MYICRCTVEIMNNNYNRPLLCTALNVHKPLSLLIVLLVLRTGKEQTWNPDSCVLIPENRTIMQATEVEENNAIPDYSFYANFFSLENNSLNMSVRISTICWIKQVYECRSLVVSRLRLVVQEMSLGKCFNIESEPVHLFSQWSFFTKTTNRIFLTVRSMGAVTP